MELARSSRNRPSALSPWGVVLKTLSAAVLGIALVLVYAGTALAQPAVDTGDSGLWWEFSAAGGGMLLSCQLCDPDRELGPAAGVAVGTYADPRLRVGLEGGMWANDDGEVRESVYRAGILAHLHPRTGSGLNLIAGMGWSGYRAELITYDAIRLSLGLGWDLPLTGSWVVGNRLMLDAASFASLKNEEGDVANSVGLSVLTLGAYIRRR